MPTFEKPLDSEIAETIWTSPLKSHELSLCFATLAKQIAESENVVHLLFDIRGAGAIPTQAPMLFIRSGIASQPNLGSIVVIGTSPVAQILAQIAVKMTGKNILFFATEAEVMAYLQDGRMRANKSMYADAPRE
jgi:hypothetical protein